MATENDADLLARAVAEAAAAPRAARTLILDLDGTLAPLVVDPAAVVVPARTLASIERLIDRGWTIALVSGRPARDVRRIAPLTGARVFGSHGMEHDGEALQRLSPPARRALATLARRSRGLDGAVPGAIVEKKPAGVAFHDRGVAPAARARWRRLVTELLAASDLTGLETLRGRRVVEVRPAGWHKGLVLAALDLPTPAPRRALDRSLVALGDDRTDEDLFRRLSGRGLTVRVGRPRRGTAAARRLASPAAVARFLAALLRAIDERPARRARGMA